MELLIGLVEAEEDGSHLALLLLEAVLWVVQIQWPALLVVGVVEIAPVLLVVHQFMEAEVAPLLLAAEILFTAAQEAVVEFLYLAVTGESY
jgi:hypothetical protein